MLARLTRTGRLRAAIVLTLFYAFCSVAPSVAMSFGDAARAAHCLTGDDAHGLRGTQPHLHAAASGHAEANGPHEHGGLDGQSSDDHGKTSDTKCCGLICVPALAASLSGVIMPDVPRAVAIATNEGRGAGQIPPRLDRPPNYPLSH